jgi:hypothetical protein
MPVSQTALEEALRNALPVEHLVSLFVIFGLAKI